MMGVDFGALLARKYDLMQQQVDTQKLGMTASANLDNVKAGLMPRQATADIGLVNAQAGLATAGAAKTNEETKYVGDIARAGVYNTRQQGDLFGSETTANNQLSRLVPARGMGLGTLGDGTLQSRVERFLRGGM
jgi:hypothetical protein